MKLVFLGGGGHAKAIILEVLESSKDYEILGYTDEKDRGVIYGVKYIGNDTKIPADCKIINCIGSTEKTNLRAEIYKKYKHNIVGFISKKAIISSTFKIPCFNKEGIQIMAGAIINAGVSIGENTLINSGAIIEHECVIGASCHVAPGAIICGSVTIKNNVHIGAGSVVIQSLTIAEKVIIGAGSTVTKNINMAGVYFGSPATFNRHLL